MSHQYMILKHFLVFRLWDFGDRNSAYLPYFNIFTFCLCHHSLFHTDQSHLFLANSYSSSILLTKSQLLTWASPLPAHPLFYYLVTQVWFTVGLHGKLWKCRISDPTEDWIAGIESLFNNIPRKRIGTSKCKKHRLTRRWASWSQRHYFFSPSYSLS